mmetsp:Transcript_83690/g.233084  ORF Transcript_83690/g.233084 Transcript_83690/m.233084 type:complete len:317 (+) Transcript_83690:22-972(+)
MSAAKEYAPMSLEEGACPQGAGPECVEEGVAPAPRRWRLTAAALAAGVGALALVGLRGAAPGPQHGEVAAAEEKVGIIAIADSLATGLGASAKVAEEVRDIYPDLMDAWGNLTQPAEEFKRMMANGTLSGALSSADLAKLSSMGAKELLHPNTVNRHDGNVCPNDEEVFEGMCYAKCADLTNGTYTIRSSPWACCNAKPCSFFNSKTVAPIPCHGFDVAGAAEGGGCPHTPGACMVNEEYNLGTCYKKCAILTNNTFPYRSAASSCCRYDNHLACLDVVNVNTSVAFAVGGGVDDGTNTTPSKPHAPIPALAEATK